MSVTSAEAALLGLLSEGAKHPYHIEKDVQYRDMRFWTELSMSAIYKALTKLEFMNFVESTTEISEENRARKVYQLTPDGMLAFKEKLTELLKEPEHLRWQADIAFYNLAVFTPEEQVNLLSAYKEAILKSIQSYRELEAFMQEGECSKYHLSVSLRPIYLMEGELKWVDDFIGQIKNP
ncbi:MAG: PadR family transcriptional regulator [Candidatus Cloacimonetes bacterium HGW-Cloacimonetes-1]|jgi:DNA-binding PadR family transcriptional regulator|nr:MAG: PadR family transcriptional regulator [Candidatus Cloacimonetes bacterium HGW-Cloacimonetes-1]